MPSQLFTDNALTTISGAILSTDTIINVPTGDGALFSTPTAGDWQELTIDDDTNREIVLLTGRLGDVLTVTRSSTAFGFADGVAIGGVLTSSALQLIQSDIVAASSATPTNVLVVDNGGNTKGYQSLTVQPGRSVNSNVSSGSQSLAIGRDARSAGALSVSIGTLSRADGANCLSIGYNSGSFSGNTSTSTTCVGEAAQPFGDHSTSLGRYCRAYDRGLAAGNGSLAGIEAVSLGSLANAFDSSVAIGKASLTGGINAIAIGDGAIANIQSTINLAGFHIVPKAVAQVDAARLMSSPEGVSFSALVDLTTTSTVNFNFDSLSTFYPSEVGLIIAASAGATVSPSVSFGYTGNTSGLITSNSTGKTSLFGKKSYKILLNEDGQIQINATVTGGATATTLTGRFYIKGVLVENE